MRPVFTSIEYIHNLEHVEIAKFAVLDYVHVPFHIDPLAGSKCQKEGMSKDLVIKAGRPLHRRFSKEWLPRTR